GHETIESQRTSGGWQVGGVDVVFDRNGDTVQRPTYFSLRPFTVPRVSFLKRLGIHGDRGVELVFVKSDSREILRHQLTRRDAPLLHGRLHLGDAGFNYAEVF